MPLKKKKKKTAARKKAKKAVIKRVVKKKPARKKITKKKAPVKKTKAKIVGVVTHYFPHVRAAVVKMKGPINVGDAIKIKGHTTDLLQSITSMQIDHVPVTSAKKGQEIGLSVNSRVREHDIVYKA